MDNNDNERIINILKESRDFIDGKYKGEYKKSINKKPIEKSHKEMIASFFVNASDYLEGKLMYVADFAKKVPCTLEYLNGNPFNSGTIESDPRYFLNVMLRFCWEYNLYLNHKDINHSIFIFQVKNLEILNQVEESEWGGQPSNFSFDFTWISNFMPFVIYKRFLQSPGFESAKKIANNIAIEEEKIKDRVDELTDIVTNSIECIDSIENKAMKVMGLLEGIRGEGNFKLLSKAFSSIKSSKSKEINAAQWRLWGVIMFLISVPAALFSYFIYRDVSFTWVGLFRYVPLISIEILLFYFMRLFYLEAKSLKSQLMQIDLRLNLCEFIYDYVESKDKSPSDAAKESWKAFEALIFSPIQPNEDKIPSVMDGTDVLAELAGKILKAKS